jgi:hypothetical protein
MVVAIALAAWVSQPSARPPEVCYSCFLRFWQGQPDFWDCHELTSEEAHQRGAALYGWTACNPGAIEDGGCLWSYPESQECYVTIMD